jgi:hypothetical protein
MLAIATRRWNEMNDFCAHENPSHTAIATRPAKASDIRYTVMPVSFAELFALVHAWISSGHSSIFAKMHFPMDCPVKPGNEEFAANLKTNVRHDRLMRSFQARTLSRNAGPRASVDLCHAACRHVRACSAKA